MNKVILIAVIIHTYNEYSHFYACFMHLFIAYTARSSKLKQKNKASEQSDTLDCFDALFEKGRKNQ